MTRPYIERTIRECLEARLLRRHEPYRVASAAELREPLEAWLREVLGSDAKVGELVRAPGGASKENFFFTVSFPRMRAAGTSATQVRAPAEERSSRSERARHQVPESKELLLRLDPGESIVETDRRREFEILRAVEDTVPAPRVVAVDHRGSRLGRPALVMERVSGKTQPELGGRPSGVGIAFEPALRERLAGEFLDALVRLHEVDRRGRDLPSFDVPRTGTTDAAAWSLAWWERVWEEARLEDHPVMVMAVEWLRAHLPAADRIVLVHGDYRSGNFLYDDRGRITAMLDWELAHLGDPHEDLGWVVNELFSVRAPSGERLACGLLPREEMLGRYEHATGWKINGERLRFYEIFNNYKLAVCAHATTLRIARGCATHLAASMSLIHAFGHSYVAALARALAIGQNEAVTSPRSL